MDASEVLRFLQAARRELACEELAIRCDCKNLETVFLVERCGELAVTDHRDTLQYLDRSDDTAHTKLDIEVARAICRRHGVELDERDPELYPEVFRVVGDLPLRVAIDSVASAVDGLFAAATELGRARGRELPE